MADPRTYGIVAIGVLVYVMFGHSLIFPSNKYAPPPDPALTWEGKQMELLRYAADEEKPIYRMTRKELQHRINSQRQQQK
jgi:hypothetical protein